jgi:Nitroreductase family
MTQDCRSRCRGRVATLHGVLLVMSVAVAFGQSPPSGTVHLPVPRQSGGLPLMEVLAKPATPVDLGSGRLSMQHLSNLLWAGASVARPKDPAAAADRSVPNATDIFVLLKAGAFAYDPASHRLQQIVAQDIRGLCGMQDPRWQAPVTLVYVVDLAKSARRVVAERDLGAALDAGVMAQNVALYCASESLSAGERTIANPRALGRRLRLRPDQRVVAAQVVGYQQQ